MNPLHKYVSKHVTRTTAIGATIGALCFDTYAEKMFTENVLNYRFLLMALCLFVFVYLLAWVSEIVVFEQVIGKQNIRKKIFGKKFIEGLWAEAILQEGKNGKKLRGVSIITISNNNEDVQISGETFLCNGSPDGSFASKSTTYHGFVLDYTYIGALLRSDKIPLGYGSLVFGQLNESSPISFHGRFNGEELNEDGRSIQVKGLKLKEEDVIRWEKGDDRTEIVTRYAAYFKERFPDFESSCHHRDSGEKKGQVDGAC